MSHIPLTFTELSDGWTVTAVAGPVPDTEFLKPIPAQVPGEVHTDLARVGLIGDPFDGDNESAQQWIGDTVWRFETEFVWSDDGRTRQDLVAYGLDTVATLELNGAVIGQTQNQHRSYRFDVGERLTDGVNTLVVTFAAPVPESLARAEKYGALPRVNHHEYNQLRKVASSFGWDWGIDVAGAGIWKPIGIDSWSGVRIESVRPLVDVEGGDGVLTVHVEVERASSDADVPAPVRIQVQRVGSADEPITATSEVSAGASSATVVARVPEAELWWPAGHGAQPLYQLRVFAGETATRPDAGSSGAAGHGTPAEWEGRIGFRTVQVDTEPDDAGSPFTVRINGETVLIRGVNWIPDHAFVTQIDAARYASRIADAIEANVNLIRVWGGGMYESDDFYDLADERGILVWQDFLLACAAYAEEDHMAAEVEAEAREQIARLSPHPSLVIWNGNNENIWGFADWGWRRQLGDRTWGDGYYRRLLPNLLAELDPTRFYSPGSPYSFGEYLHPNDERNGTMHIWDVWNRRDYTVYRDYRPRFVSEFGFQGPPAWSTLTRVVHDEPLDPYGPHMLVHQKAALGNQKLDRGRAGHLPQPQSIEDWHWSAQLNQAHAIRFGVEHFRSLAPHNTGTILWQLNDNWPVVSWAAVDFDGHRKPLWFALSAAYAPRLATFQPRSSPKALSDAFEGYRPDLDQLALVLLNDTAEQHDGSFTVSRQTLDGEVLAEVVLDVTVPARGELTVAVPSSVSTFADTGNEVLIATASDSTAGFARAVLGAEVVDQRLDPSPVTATVAKVSGGYVITVTAHSFARDIFVNSDRVDAAASVDCGLITLLAGESAQFPVASSVDVDPDAFLHPLVLRTANSLLIGGTVAETAH